MHHLPRRVAEKPDTRIFGDPTRPKSITPPGCDFAGSGPAVSRFVAVHSFWD